MNRLSKYTLLLAVGLCIFGVIFLAVGAGFGGLDFLSSKNLDSTSLSSSDKQYQMPKTKIDDFDQLEIDTSYMDVSIRPSEDDSCYLSYNITGNETANPFQYKIDNGTLSIKEDHSAESHFFVGIDYSSLANLFTGRTIVTEETDSVTLWIPSKKQYTATAISSEDGDISIEGLNVQQFSLKTSYGDVAIKNSSLGNVTFYSSDGDLSCENTSFSGSCAFDLTYGEAAFTLVDSQKTVLSLSLETNYGEISVTDKLSEGASIGYEDDAITSYQKTGSSPDNYLSITCDDGDIDLK